MWRSNLLIGLALVAVGCGPSSVRAPRAPLEDDTTLGVGDQFDVRVYGEDDLSANYQVAQDGTIDFPYLGNVEVAGHEPPAVAALLAERLREGQVLVDPQVSVVVTVNNSRWVIIRGAVRTPGNHPLTPGLTVLRAIGLAGGTTDLANRDGAIITRRIDGDAHRYAAPLDRITVGESEDVRLVDRDIIFVPERVF